MGGSGFEIEVSETYAVLVQDGRIRRVEEYRTELAGLADSVRAASPDLVHVFNLVENDWRYWRDAVPSSPSPGSRPRSVRAGRAGSSTIPRSNQLRSVRIGRARRVPARGRRK